MKNDILSLAKKLISVPSTKENPQDLIKVLELAKKELNGFSSESFVKNGVHSLLVFNTDKRPSRFKIILNAHLDVVPAKKEQFQPVEKNGRLYGRGAIDMKAAAAVEILVFKNIAKKIKYPLGLQLVTDEEIGGHNGALYQIEEGVRADFTLAGEQTDFAVNNQAKGVIWLKLKANGKAAHGAYLWEGVNAIWKIKDFLDRLEKEFPVPTKEVWKTTVNLARVETSNQTFNKVPEDCVVSLDIRYIPKDKNSILKKIKKISQGFDITINENEPIHFTSENNQYLKQLRNITKGVLGKLPSIVSTHGASDIRHFTQEGGAGVIFGPIGFGLHTNEEWVNIKSLAEYYQILERFLYSLRE